MNNLADIETRFIKINQVMPIKIKTALYRHYDSDNKLLYVGISITPAKRFKEHVTAGEWAEESVKMTIQWFDSRPEAERAEQAAIVNEQPEWNRMHNIREPRTYRYIPKVVEIPKKTKEIEEKKSPEGIPKRRRPRQPLVITDGKALNYLKKKSNSELNNFKLKFDALIEKRISELTMDR